MATFFLGQRVRVNCPSSLSHGRECQVVGIDVLAEDGGVQYVGVQVDIVDRWSGYNCVFDYHELEPIQPSGHRAGDYSLSELLDRCRAGEGVAA